MQTLKYYHLDKKNFYHNEILPNIIKTHKIYENDL